MEIIKNPQIPDENIEAATHDYDMLSSPRIGVTSLDITELLTLEGYRFYSEYDEVLSSGEVVYVLFQMPPDLSGRTTGLQNRNFKSSSGEVELEVLWDTTGMVIDTNLPIFNENNGSLASPQMVVSVLTSVTADGTVREKDFLLGGGQGSNSSGDISPSLGFRIYKEGTFFVAKMTNTHNSANRVHISYSWVEIPDSYI